MSTAAAYGLEKDAERCVVRAASCEKICCGVMVDFALGESEGCDRVEAGFLEGIEAPVEDALVLAPGGSLCEHRVHTSPSALKRTPSMAEGMESITRSRDARTSPERGMPGGSRTRRIDCR